LAELVEQGGGRWLEPPREGPLIDYAVPVHADAEVRRYLETRARVRGPNRGTAWLPAARVFGSGVVLSADGRLLARDVCEDFGKGPDEHWLLGYDQLREPEDLPGETAVAAVNRGAGYCHWLLEELPRLLALPKRAGAQVILHAGAEPMRAAWARRGGTERCVAVRRSQHHRVASLVVPALAAEAGAPNPESVGAVREFAADLPTSSSGVVTTGAGAERIYISRQRAARRRVINEDEIWRALEAEGFVRVFLEELAWADQIAVMRLARVVVAVHGAGLANLLFCAPGTRVVEMVNQAYFNPVFWRLSAVCGLDYRPVLDASERWRQEPLGEDRRRNKDDLLADVARVVAAATAL
jgi:capsular polysaccharide biosynthesis protein